jgi:hypothetical protein
VAALPGVEVVADAREAGDFGSLSLEQPPQPLPRKLRLSRLKLQRPKTTSPPWRLV